MGCFTPQALPVLSALAAAATVSHLEEISAELISRQYPAGTPEGAVAPPPRLTRPPASS
jgi:hypothetical protein